MGREVFGMLMQAGSAAEPVITRSKDNLETPLHAAAFHWGGAEPTLAREIAIKLLEARAALEARGPAGGTPLHMAVNGRNWALVSLLLERRADPSIRNDAGRSV